MATPEDLAAKIGYIRAFFDDLEGKVAFAKTLYEQKRMDEGRLLVCVYIESLGNGIYHPSQKFAANFCRALIEHSDHPILSVVLPHWLLTKLPWNSASTEVQSEIRNWLTPLPQRAGFTYSELLARARPGLSHHAFSFLEREGWVGTTSMAVYGELRSPGAHWFGSPGGVAFSETTWQGEPLMRIGFEDLHTALSGLLRQTRGVSLSSGLWFGNPDVA